MSSEEAPVLGRGVSRRSFLQIAAAAGGGLTVGVLLDGCAHVSGAQALGGGGFNPNAWVHVAPDDTVSFFLDRAEMGQGVLTGHLQMLCEELEIAPERVKVEMAPADFRKYGVQVTGGSTSTTSAFDVLREAGATARELLRKAAAKRWGVPLDEVRAQDGALMHARLGTLRYGDVSGEASACILDDHPTLKDPRDWKWIGKSLRRVDAAAKVDGSALFSIDVRLPGMLTAVVVRPPALGAKLKRVDMTRARAAPGVRHVIEIPQGIAVVADCYWPARSGAELLDVEWDVGALSTLSSDAIRWKRVGLLRERAQPVLERGDAPSVIAKASKRARGVYELPYVAHATMEPMNATAHVEPTRCRVWAGTQAPTVVKVLAARLTGLPTRDIDVITTLMGGGFGRRGLPEFCGEPIELSKRLGVPVKVVWSREDDMRHDQYRPAAMSFVEGTVDADGWPSAWLHRLSAQSLMASYTGMIGDLHLEVMPRHVMDMLGDVGKLFIDGHLIDPTTVEGATDIPYRLPHTRVEIALHDPGVPVSAWRSVGHSINAFVVESFMDELAHLGGKDPLAVRRRLLAEGSRHRRVLDACARAIGWDQGPPPGRFWGIAQHACFGSYCAQAVEISVADGLRVHRVVAAIDCGRAVNPDLVAAQMESGVVFGLSAALHQRIDFVGGRVVQGNFHDHPLLRMRESPRVDTVIVESSERPTGVGELAVPPVAAALGNAFFAATGVRLRRMPMMKDAELVLAGGKPEEVML